MTPESFAYWLQGFFELSDADELTEAQVKSIKDHLALVFTKVTPDRKTKKKKSKKLLTESVETTEQKERLSVFPGENLEQIRLNIEESMKKRQKELQDSVRVTCDASSTTEKLMETVKESAKRAKERHTYPSPTRWNDGGFGRKYC